MSKEVITLIAKKHNTWVDIVTTFGCPKRIAEDITQEMYIKIHFQLEKEGNNIMYNDDVNYYYIFKTLKTLYLDLKRKHKNWFCPLNFILRLLSLELSCRLGGGATY